MILTVDIPAQHFTVEVKPSLEPYMKRLPAPDQRAIMWEYANQELEGNIKFNVTHSEVP